jgi:integrase
MPATAKDPVFSDPDCRSFRFTVARIEAACRAVAAGDADTDAEGRRQWRDADTPGLFLRASRSGAAVFVLFYKRDGRPIRKVIGQVDAVSLPEAREAAGALRHDRTLAAQVAAPRERSGDGKSRTIGETFEAYIADAEAGLFTLGRRRQPITDRTAQNYRDTYNATLKAHEAKSLEWLADNILRLHREIGTAGKGNAAKPARPYQANRMLQAARNTFTYAASKGFWKKPNPCVDPATGGMVAKFAEHSRDRILKDEEETRLGKVLQDEPALWRDLFAIALLTGRRMTAVCRMQWGDVDLGRRIWTVPRQYVKGRKSAHGLQLDPDAVAILKRRKADAAADCEWVFPAVRSPGPVITWKTAWGRIRAAAGLHHKDRARSVRPHDLRRSWGSRLVEAGVPTVTVNHALGNSASSISMTARVYMHVPDTVQAAAIDAAYERRKSRKAKAKRSAKRARAKAPAKS